MTPILVFADALFESTCEIAKAHKLDDPHEDLPLSITYVPAGTRSVRMIIPMGEGAQPPELLMVSLMAAYEKWGPPVVIITSADAHMKFMPEDFDIDSYERGDFARDPASKEVLGITAYCRDDDGHIRVNGRYLPYGYDDDGAIRFDDVINMEEPPGGAFDEIIRQVFNRKADK